MKSVLQKSISKHISIQHHWCFNPNIQPSGNLEKNSIRRRSEKKLNIWRRIRTRIEECLHWNILYVRLCFNWWPFCFLMNEYSMYVNTKSWKKKNRKNVASHEVHYFWHYYVTSRHISCLFIFWYDINIVLSSMPMEGCFVKYLFVWIHHVETDLFLISCMEWSRSGWQRSAQMQFHMLLNIVHY